jgi:hypothetical protein
MAMGVGWISRFDDLRMDEMLLGIKLRIVTRLVMKSARKIMLDLASARLWMSRFFIFICFAYHAIDCVGGKGFFIAPISLAIWLPAGWSTKFAHKQHERSALRA